KHSQELLEYAIGTCPHGSQPRAKQLAHIPLIRKKKVIIPQPSNKLDSTTHPHVVTVISQKTNVPVPPSTGVECCPIASGSQPMRHVKPNRISPAKDKMADVNAPSDQTLTMAPPVRTDDQILPHIRWIPIGKSNCYLDLEKSQSNPIYKIAVDLLKNTNFFRAFKASSNLPSIYIQQFWDTILYDKKAGCYKCQLDEQWFDLTKETSREAFQITLVDRNQAFAAHPSIDGLIDFVNQLGYPKLVMNLSTVVTNDLFQPWRALLTIINLCLTGKTFGFERPRAPRKHRFHLRPDSPLYLSNEEPVLGYLKFSTKGTKREIFEMPIPGRLITENIREASYYQEYQENVAKHRGFLVGETESTQDLPAPKPAKPARKPQSTAQKAPPKPSISSPVTSTQPAPTSVPAKTHENKCKQATRTTDKPAKAKRIKRSASRKTRQPRSSPKYVGASEAEEVPAEEPQVADEDANFQKAVEESMKDAYALPKGLLPPVVIREPESGKYQPLPEVPGNGNAKVSEEQVSHDLLSLQKHKKTNSEEESKKITRGVKKGGQDEGQAGPDPDAQAEDQMGTDAGAQAEGQAGSNPDETFEGQARSNPDETSKGQARLDPGNAKARVQSTSSLVVQAGSDREHMDLDVANVSPQPSTEQLYEGFTATVYPNVQENLKLVVEEPVLLEEHASSSGTLSSLQHLSRDFSFGDQFFSDKHSDADKSKETKVESMVNVTIQQALSSISLMTLPIIDLTSRPESPKEHQQLKATTTDTTTTTTTLPPPQAPQQSTIEVMMVKRIELAHDLAEARKKRKKGRESPKTPPGSPSHQPPPPLPPVGPSGTSGAPRAFGSQVTPPPPPPSSTNQDSPSKGSAAPIPSNTAATTEHQAWITPDVTLKPLVSLTPEDLDMDEAMGLDEQAQLSDEEDIGSAYIPTVNLRQGRWKPFEEERPTTPEPAWSIRSSDEPFPTNNWASALASNYSPPPEDSLLTQTGPAYEIVKVFHPDVIHLQYKIEEFHKLLIDNVDDPILRHNISKPLPLRGPPGQVTIQSDFFFNKDLEYLRYGSKGRRPALSISKMKAAYYPDARLEQMTLVNLTKPQWTATGFECKHDYTVIESPRAVIFRDKYEVQMMMHFNEIHKFSDGTLQQIVEPLDYRVKEFRINRINPEAFEDTENLPQPGELCWRTRQRGRLQTFEAYRLIKLLQHFRPLSDDLWQSAPASDHSKSKRTIESRAGHDSTLLASSHTVKSKTDIKSPTHYPRANELTNAFGKPFEMLNNVFEHWVLNSLVHLFRALSALRRSGLRTASTAAKPCQGDSSEFYLITGSIHTDQRGTVVLATLFNEGVEHHYMIFHLVNGVRACYVEMICEIDFVRYPQFPLNYKSDPGYIENYNSYPYDSSSFPQQELCCENYRVTHEAYQSHGTNDKITSMYEMVCQFIQKKQEEKRIEEEQAAKAQNSKIPACCDDDDDYNSAITPNEPVDSLSMGDEHLNTIPTTESDEFIKSSVENLVPNPSESEGENECNAPACFTTFSNILFDADYEFDSVDDQSLSDEDVPEKIFLNPLFEEEIISMKIDPHHFNAESDLIESLLNHDSSIIPSSSKIDSLLDEFAGELTLLKSIPPGIDKTDFKYALTASPTIYTSCIKQFWTSAKVKPVNYEVRIQALVDSKRVNIKESFIRHTLRLNEAKGTSCLTNIEIFEGLAKIVPKPLYGMSSAALWHLPLSKKHKPKRKHTQESKVPPTESPTEQSLPLPFNDLLPSGEDSLKLKELMELCTNLSNKVLELESEVIDIKSTYQERIEKLEGRVERLNEENRVLKELKSVHSIDDADEPVMEKKKSSKQGMKIEDIDVDVKINLEKAQAKAYNLDLNHQQKVLSMMDEEEPADVEEVLEVVKAAKLMTEVVTTAGATKVSVPRKRRGVSIQDPEKTTTTATMQPKVQAKDKGKAILIEEPKPLKANEVNEGVKVLETGVRQEKDVEVESSKREDATPLASKILIVDYKIHTKRNRPYFMIIRADGNHMLFISLRTMLKNLDREDLESLWIIVRDRFEKTKPKNYSDDYLLNTLKIMFEKPNVEASRMYPLTHFTLEQMLTNVRLQVEDESKMSLELLRLGRIVGNNGLLQVTTADEDLVLLVKITAGEEERRRQY
nr:hypothetical protein [Tanacetum cinerariifolium]